VSTSDLIDLDQIAIWWGLDPEVLRIHAAKSVPA